MQEEPPTNLMEARRIVDGQIELARTYGRRAQTLVRICLTIFGLYISAIVIAIQFVPNGSGNSQVLSLTLGITTIESQLVQGLEFISEPIGSLLAIIPMIAILIISQKVLSSLDDLTNEVVGILEPTRLHKGVPPYEGMEVPIDEYLQIIEENEEKLSQIKESWKTISDALIEIVGGTTVALLLIGGLIFGNAELIAYTSIFSLLIIVIYLIQSDIEMPNVRLYAMFEPKVDISGLLVFVGIASVGFINQPTAPDLLSIIDALIIVFLPIQMVWGYTQFEHEKIRKLSIRNIGSFCIFYLSFVIYLIIPGASVSLTSVASLFFAAILVSLFQTLVSLLVWLVDVIRRFVGDALQRSNE